MNTLKIFHYCGNLFKKSLEYYIQKLIKKIPQYLEIDELEKTKRCISQIESLKKLQKEIDLLIVYFNEQFPDENVIESVGPSKEREKPVSYIFQILENLEMNEEVNLFELKTFVYNEIVSHITTSEVSTNCNIPKLLNWEVNFYKTISFLLDKGYIYYDESNYIDLTEKGKQYLGSGYFHDPYDIEINATPLDSELLCEDSDSDLISSIRSYVLTNLISEGVLSQNEDPDYYKDRFQLAKNVYSMDGAIIEKWDDLRENQFYRVVSYFHSDETTIFLRNKYANNYVLECVTEDDLVTYFIFLSISV